MAYVLAFYYTDIKSCTDSLLSLLIYTGSKSLSLLCLLMIFFSLISGKSKKKLNYFNFQVVWNLNK